jgi:hypothetical protein
MYIDYNCIHRLLNMIKYFYSGQNACPKNYSSQMRFADPIICSHYIQCVDSHLEQRTCSNNFLFDRISKTCKAFDQAECHGNKPDHVSPMIITSTMPCKSSDYIVNNVLNM